MEALEEKLSGLNAALGERESVFSFAVSPQQETHCAIAAAIHLQVQILAWVVCVCGDDGGRNALLEQPYPRIPVPFLFSLVRFGKNVSGSGYEKC